MTGKAFGWLGCAACACVSREVRRAQQCCKSCCAATSRRLRAVSPSQSLFQPKQLHAVLYLKDMRLLHSALTNRKPDEAMGDKQMRRLAHETVNARSVLRTPQNNCSLDAVRTGFHVLPSSDRLARPRSNPVIDPQLGL